jgi:hypothetical protein
MASVLQNLSLIFLDNFSQTRSMWLNIHIGKLNFEPMYNSKIVLRTTRDMKRKILLLALTLITFTAFAQSEKLPIEPSSGETFLSVPYRLFPTQNMWTFIKLDTRNGKMWQVQYSMESESRFETILSFTPLVVKEKEVNNRFTLYPTQNIYTFILLDQIEGKTWQVQWSTKLENRAVVPIVQ